MADTTRGHPQTPSKVLHIRNLPYEVTEEELIELCEPFGSIVATKLHVGTNKNQAFVEFPELQLAVQMVTYFQNSAEPAKVRGKTVYLQYSNRNQITNSTSQMERPTTVLQVHLDGLSGAMEHPDAPVLLDTLHVVFSAFGEVLKIATFDKPGAVYGFVQYADLAVAQQVRRDLDGRYIPRHLQPNSLNPPMMKISFSQHGDLAIKYQSQFTRDYTNPALPIAPPHIDPTQGIGLPLQMGSEHTPRSNVLHLTVENQAYPVTIDALHTVFSPYGLVHKITIFEKNGVTQALVQMPDESTAESAKGTLEGHAIYDGGFNKMKLGYSIHRDLSVRVNGDRSWDWTVPQVAPARPQQAPPGPSGLNTATGFAPAAGFGAPPQGRPQGSFPTGPTRPRWNEIPNVDCTAQRYMLAAAAEGPLPTPAVSISSSGGLKGSTYEAAHSGALRYAKAAAAEASRPAQQMLQPQHNMVNGGQQPQMYAPRLGPHGSFPAHQLSNPAPQMALQGQPFPPPASRFGPDVQQYGQPLLQSAAGPGQGQYSQPHGQSFQPIPGQSGQMALGLVGPAMGAPQRQYAPSGPHSGRQPGFTMPPRFPGPANGSQAQPYGSPGFQGPQGPSAFGQQQQPPFVQGQPPFAQPQYQGQMQVQQFY